MNRTISFTKRNFLEMRRDVLSYIFCVALPIVMLIIMSVVNESIPKESGNTIFRIDNLSGGIGIFSQTFTMLFTALMVSQDRSTSFLTRLFASPMKSGDFTGGYVLSMLFISTLQSVIVLISSWIVSLITKTSLSVPGMLMAFLTLIPTAIFFIALGMIIGTFFNEKSAPGICSVIISLGSFVGGIWFDAESTGGILLTISKCTPFYYCTKLIRASIHLDFSAEQFLIPLLITLCGAALLILLAVYCFKRKMRADLQ